MILQTEKNELMKPPTSKSKSALSIHAPIPVLSWPTITCPGKPTHVLFCGCAARPSRSWKRARYVYVYTVPNCLDLVHAYILHTCIRTYECTGLFIIWRSLEMECQPGRSRGRFAVLGWDASLWRDGCIMSYIHAYMHATVQ
jgi:hypothetical protein